MSFIYNMSDTWNAIGTTFDAIKMNISDGAGGVAVGGANSDMLNLQNAGVSIFQMLASGIYRQDRYGNSGANATVMILRKATGTPLAPTAVTGGDDLGTLLSRGYGSTAFQGGGALVKGVAAQNFTDANGGQDLYFGTNPLNAISTVIRNIITSEGLFVFGATKANTVPAFKPSSSDLQLRLGDDTDFASMAAVVYVAGRGGTTVASLPVASSYQGGLSFVTDAAVSATLAVGATLVGGGANKIMVYSDGTQWKGI